MAAANNSHKDTLENINNIIRGLSLLGIVWVVNTTNVTEKNLSILTNDVKHMQKSQQQLKAELVEKMAHRFTAHEGNRLKEDLRELEQDLDEHIKKGGK